MDLNAILNKTKVKSEKIKIVRKPPSIAMDDRPYTKEEAALYSNTNKSTTNWQQTDNKPITNRQQTGNRIELIKAKNEETDNKLATKPATEVTTNWQQTDNKPATKTSFSSLIGLQRSIVIFIYQECKSTRSKTSDPITLEYLSTYLKCSTGTAKTTLQRLETKGYIVRKEFKNGRGGWSRYEIPEKVFHELLQKETDNKLTTNRQQTDNKVGTQPTTQLTTSLPSSSSNSLINKNTTTDDKAVLLTEWETMDIEPLAEIGFSKYHLTQIASQNKLMAPIVQESIWAFAFDLKENNKGKSLKTSPLNYFMGILRNGNPYAPPSNFEYEADKALRIYLERKQEIEKKRIDLEEKIFDVEFMEWRKNLTNEQIDKLLPEDVKNQNLAAPKTVFLRSYYRNEIWPMKRQEIIKISI
jgi:hypothetical protein